MTKRSFSMCVAVRIWSRIWADCKKIWRRSPNKEVNDPKFVVIGTSVYKDLEKTFIHRSAALGDPRQIQDLHFAAVLI